MTFQKVWLSGGLAAKNGLMLGLFLSLMSVFFAIPALAISAPTELSGLVLWLDGDDPIKVGTPTHGQNISIWFDKSGNNYDAYLSSLEYPTYTTNALNGKGVVSFDGVNNNLTMPNRVGMNVPALGSTFAYKVHFYVFKTGADVKARQIIYEQGGVLNGMNLYVESGNLYTGWWSESQSATAVYHSTPVAANTAYIVAHIYDSNADIVATYVNGKGIQSTPKTQLLNLHGANIGIGSMRADTQVLPNTNQKGTGLYFGGDIAELVFYSHDFSTATVLTDSERIDMTYYLSQKWGLATTTDSDGDGFNDNVDLLPTDNLHADFDGVPNAQDSYPLDSSKVVDFPFALSRLTGNLILWLDASRASAFATRAQELPVNGSTIAEWYDWSGKGNSVSQNTTIYRPIYVTNGQNNHSVIRFDGNNDRLQIPIGVLPTGNSERTFIFAFKTISGGQSLLDYGTNATGGRVSITASEAALSVAVNGHDFGVNLSNSGFVIGTIQVDSGRTSSDWNIFRNALKLSPSSRAGSAQSINTGATYAHIGTDTSLSNFQNGDIAEILVFNKALTETERIAVEVYLSNKWNIPLKDIWLGCPM